jgi:hypothetical protein
VRMLKLAVGSATKGNQKAVDRMLRTFVHQVSVQSGKLLTSAQAVTLIQDARSLMGLRPPNKRVLRDGHWHMVAVVVGEEWKELPPWRC